MKTLVNVSFRRDGGFLSQNLSDRPGAPSIPNSFARSHAGPGHISRQRARMEPPERV